MGHHRASTALTLVALLSLGLSAAAAEPPGGGIDGPKLTRPDLGFAITAPSRDWQWQVGEQRNGFFAFQATHLATRSQAVLTVVPLEGRLTREFADGVVSGMIESIAGRQPGFAEAGRSVKPSAVPQAGSFRVETRLTHAAQGVTVRFCGCVFAKKRLFTLVVMSTSDSGKDALDSLIGSFRFL